MGFLEVIRNLGTIIQNIKACKEDILQYKPTTLILIDYPGFNLRIAKWAKEQGIPVIYYISPQVWAWKENRVKLIRKCVDLMLVILPFEKAFYQKWDYEVKYVGHPLVEVVDDFLNSDKGVIRVEDERKETIALLPGSRKQEILKKLPIMLDVAKHFPNYQFVVAKAPGLDEEFYAGLLEPYKNVSSVADKTYALLVRSKAALVTSGTATLETALFGVPEVICYKGSSFSYQIAKRLISIKYIGLVNLIMDKEVVKELIQDKLTVENLKHELNLLLTDEAKKMQIRQDYDALKKLLGQGGHASSNAADAISGFMEKLPQ
jgi:lipid-A-disaccharide synthase